jgi:hypothetical protein
MARVRLYRDEVGPDQLPTVCMRCGQPSVVYRRKSFSWYPAWVWVLLLAGLLPFLIVALILTKKMTIYAPLCAAHRHHWLRRTLFTGLGLLFFVALFIGGGIAAAMLDDARQPRWRDVVLTATYGGGVVLFLVWLITAAVLQARAIAPHEITDRDITLGRVSEKFVDAVKGSRDDDDEYEDDDEYYRPRRRRRARDEEHVYDPEGRRRLPPDAYREEEV